MVLTPIKSPSHIHGKALYRRYFGFGAIGLILLAVVRKAWFGSTFGWPCPFNYWIGIPCPTWGMTRSMTAMAQGHLAESAGFHGLGPIGFILLAIAMIHLGWECATRRPLNLFYSAWLRRPAVWGSGFGVYVSYHLFRLQALAASGTLAIDFAQSPIGHLILHNSTAFHS
jgi:Protein of unknown function (DUF2752)